MANVLLKIENMLESVVQSALDEEAAERGLQLQTAKQIKGDSRSLKASDNDKKVDEAEEEEGDDEGSGSSQKGGDMSKRPVEIPDELPAAITVDMVIDGIDAIRSARSLKKPEVREEFEEYFESLSSGEKIGLLAFVYGIAETLIGSSEGRGLDPSEEPYNIEIDADPKQSSKPSTTPRATTSPQGGEGDTPIVVGGQ
jgi:hypothetical protein